MFDEIICSNFPTFATDYTVISQYIEEALGKLNKRELIGMVLSLQSKKIEKNYLILEEIRKLNDKFNKLESENAVIKQANSLLSKRLDDM